MKQLFTLILALIVLSGNAQVKYSGTNTVKGKLKMKTLDDIMSYLEAIFAKIFLQAGVLKFIGATLVISN